MKSSYLQKKWKRIEEPDTNNKNIHPEYRNKIWHEKLCDANAKKGKKKERMKGIELPNEEIIRKLGEKENYKYLVW